MKRGQIPGYTWPPPLRMRSGNVLTQKKALQSTASVLHFFLGRDPTIDVTTTAAMPDRNKS